jgi:hypothetical protein
VVVLASGSDRAVLKWIEGAVDDVEMMQRQKAWRIGHLDCFPFRHALDQLLPSWTRSKSAPMVTGGNPSGLPYRHGRFPDHFSLQARRVKWQDVTGKHLET